MGRLGHTIDYGRAVAVEEPSWPGMADGAVLHRISLCVAAFCVTLNAHADLKRV